MDKVDKFLLKISHAERGRLIPIIDAIASGDTSHLDCKKLRGGKKEYRVRIGTMRILFRKIRGFNVIFDIQHRNDHTY